MTQRVKEFVEDYIGEIELGRWEEVFDGWYQETDVDEFWEDDEQFNEFLRVLDVLNVDTQSLRDARAAIIEKYTEDIVNTIQHNNYNRIDSWSIYWGDVLMKLESLLGFSQEDIFALIFNEMDIAGVTPDYNKQRFVIEGL
jgi:hypothetical protein